MLESRKTLSECVKRILGYEYDNFLFGLNRSEFTDDIIDAEVDKLSVNNDKEYKFYTVTICQDEIVISGCETQEELSNKLAGIMQDTYVVHSGKAYIPDFERMSLLFKI